MKTAYEHLERQNARAGSSGLQAQASPDVLLRIRSAFELFDNQSALLRTSFESLKKDLASANEQLNLKNKVLSVKVEELQQVSSRLHCILESLADGVLVVNPQLKVELCNPAAEKLLNLPREAVVGQFYASITNGLGDERKLSSAIESGRITLDEQRCSAGGKGPKVIVLASVAPIRSPSGAILGAVEVMRDVTPLRALEERVQHQKRMAALGEMAASVAHEIRNPLGTIEGFARLLRHDLDLDAQPAHSRLASKIIEGAQNLNYVITNLLTYARPMLLQCDMFEVATLLGSTGEVLAATAAEKGVALDIAPPPPRLRANGDIRQLRQVFINLGRNAIEACSNDGQVKMSAAQRGREVVLTVSDDGCGIPPEDLSSIFDPFFTRKEGGTGLGLSLSHKIVTAHGGEILVSSKRGAGTTIKVVLPQIGDES